MSDIAPSGGWWRATDGKWYPPRWEYQWVTGAVKPGKAGGDFNDRLAASGRQGWEVVHFWSGKDMLSNQPCAALMKRPLIE